MITYGNDDIVVCNDADGHSDKRDAVPEVLNFSTNCVNSQTFIEYLSGRHIYISGGSALLPLFPAGDTARVSVHCHSPALSLHQRQGERAVSYTHLNRCFLSVRSFFVVRCEVGK